MTQEELDKIVEQHQHWIKEDVDGWEDMRANLKCANLYGANLKCAYLEEFRLGKILTEPMTGYKKTRITDMEGHEVLHSSYDNSFEYRLGQEINIKDFNLMYNVECASGFHFFRTRAEAENY